MYADHLLVVMRGVPGSGKTTWALEAYPDALHVRSDTWRTSPAGDYEYRPGGGARTAVYRVVRAALENGCPCVVVDQCHLSAASVRQYERLGHRHGYPVVVVRCSGAYRNTHHVPHEEVEKMRAKIEDYPREVRV